MEAAAARLEPLRRHPMRMRIAINIGPNKETPAEHVADDYQKLVRQLGGFAGFIVVNLSSPNTPGLREFQAPTRMRGVIEAIRSVSPGSHRPALLIKIAPDLDAGMLREICAAGIDLGLDGIVATNTTLMHAESGVTTLWQGGLSGEPLKLRARSIIARIRDFTGGKTAIIGVGGISSAEDAYGHIRAGANLVELYTGLVYEGPCVVGRIKQDLIRLLARDGFRSISEAVGSAGS
jgi:dihydroorotate dehydrogenase